MRQRRIQYGVDRETGFVVSRCGDQVAFAVIDFSDMCPEDGFQIKAHLEVDKAISVLPHMPLIQWTRKIPTGIKNVHRKIFDMKPL